MKKFTQTALAVLIAITLLNLESSAQQREQRDREGRRPNRPGFGEQSQNGERDPRGQRQGFRGPRQGEDRGPGAQRQGFGGRGQRGGGAEFMRMFPIIVALDTNSDGIISETEINNATAALKKLDKNKDGKLDASEMMPRPPQFRGGPRGPESQSNGPRQGGPGNSENNTNTLVDRIMKYDENGDGKLSKDEVTGRLSSIFNRADKNKDGIATRDELTEALGSAGRQRGQRNP